MDLAVTNKTPKRKVALENIIFKLLDGLCIEYVVGVRN